MRKKKFRKITEKNIASIYGKILGLRKRWIDPTNLNNVYITPMTVSYDINLSGVWSCNDSIPKCKYVSKWDVSLNKDTIIIDIKKPFRNLNCWHHMFRLTVGDKIAFTGSTIKFKIDGICYIIKLFSRSRRTIQMPSDFDGDNLLLYEGKIPEEFSYKGPNKSYDEKIPLREDSLLGGYCSPLDSPYQCVHSAMHIIEAEKNRDRKPIELGTGLLLSNAVKNLEKMYPTMAIPANSARESMVDMFYPNGQPKKLQTASVYGEMNGEMLEPIHIQRMKSEEIRKQMEDITEDDLPPLEDLLSGVAELEQHIGEQNRSMEFKIPKNWDSPRKEEE